MLYEFGSYPFCTIIMFVFKKQKPQIVTFLLQTLFHYVLTVSTKTQKKKHIKSDRTHARATHFVLISVGLHSNTVASVSTVPTAALFVLLDRFQLLSRLESTEAGLYLSRCLRGHLLLLAHQKSTYVCLYFGGRFVFHRTDRWCTGSSSTYATSRIADPTLSAHLLTHAIATEPGLDFGGRIILRLGGVR